MLICLPHYRQEEVIKLAKFTDFQTVCVVGGQSIEEQGYILRKGVEIVIGTPVCDLFLHCLALFHSHTLPSLLLSLSLCLMLIILMLNVHDKSFSTCSLLFARAVWWTALRITILC